MDQLLAHKLTLEQVPYHPKDGDIQPQHLVTKCIFLEDEMRMILMIYTISILLKSRGEKLISLVISLNLEDAIQLFLLVLL